MTSAVVAFILSCAVTSAATPLVMRWAVEHGAVDQPGGRRVHLRVTPRLGGLAVMLGFFVPLAAFAVIRTGAMSAFLQQSALILGLCLGSCVVGTVGVIDDLRGLDPWTKLAAQAVAGVIAYAAGYRIDAITFPPFGEFATGAFAVPVTVFWFLAITNAINLIDGLDGLASGITLFATLTNFAIAYMNESAVVVLLSASLAGALLGFLPFNFNPASIFLGDSGSMFLGFTLAATSLAGVTTKSSTAVALLAPIVALGIPILDTLLAMIRRAAARQSLFAADRGHIHHKLLDLGFTHRRVVLLLYLLSILLALSAVGVVFGHSWNIGVALVLVGGMVIIAVRLSFRVPPTQLNRSGLILSSPGTVAGMVDAILRAKSEMELRRVLARCSDGPAMLPKVQLLDSNHRVTEATGTERVHDVNLGQYKLRIDVEGEFEMNGQEQEKIVADLSCIVAACREVLGRIGPGSSDLDVPPLSGTVGTARTKG